MMPAGSSKAEALRARFAIDSQCLSGDLEIRLAAIRRAGFGRVMLWGRDLVGHPHGVDAAAHAVRESGLAVIGLQLLRDFEGLDGAMFDYRLEIAKSMLRLTPMVGAPLLLVSSSASPHASGGRDHILRDLLTLATLATPLRVRIGYEPLAWGRWVNEYTVGWDLVDRAGRDNLGLVLDSFHIFARGSNPRDADAIPAQRIFLAQLSDYLGDHLPGLDEVVETSLHHRVYPGEGNRSGALLELVAGLERRGYRGSYVFDVFNERYLGDAPDAVLEHARRAADWLCAAVAQ